MVNFFLSNQGEAQVNRGQTFEKCLKIFLLIWNDEI